MAIGGEGGKEIIESVVFENYGLRGRTVAGFEPTPGLAGSGADHAGKLDWQVYRSTSGIQNRGGG